MLINRYLHNNRKCKKVVLLIMPYGVQYKGKGMKNPLFHPSFNTFAAASYPHHGLVELVAVALGTVAQLHPVIVNRRDGIAQEVGYLGAAAYAEAHKGEDAQLGVELLARFEAYACLRTQQGVEIFDERRKQFRNESSKCV